MELNDEGVLMSGATAGYVQFQMCGVLSYELVVGIQAKICREMKRFGRLVRELGYFGGGGCDLEAVGIEKGGSFGAGELRVLF